MAETGTYLYAITQDPGRAVPSPLTGVAGTPVHAITHRGLVAYVSPVSLDEFGEEPLRRSLEDLDWIGGTARAHHRVVEAVARQAPTAPVRLVTVYRTEDQVRELLHRRHDDFAAVLARVAGRGEWGVKAYASPAAGGSPTPEESVPETGGPGTSYLKRRRASLRSREETWRLMAGRAERIHAALTAIAVASHRHRPQDPELSGREDPMVLNGAYLVDQERAGEFAAAVGGLREQDVDVDLTGPWAPYSFTALDLSPAGRETSNGA